MSILIDGYNLLHASGILPGGFGPSTLERSRQALLNFLLHSLEERELTRTTIVFDSNDAPPGLPDTMKHGAITVYFARGYENADAMIEELILRDSAPRQLTVVSSDHRIQRAARRRRAGAVDSDVWYSDVCRRRAEQREEQPVKPVASPMAEPDRDTIDYWIRQLEATGDTTKTNPTQGETTQPQPERPIESPFPPEYLDELDEEFGKDLS